MGRIEMEGFVHSGGVRIVRVPLKVSVRRRVRMGGSVDGREEERKESVREDLSRLVRPFSPVSLGGVMNKSVGASKEVKSAEELDKQRQDVKRIAQLFWRLAQPFWKEEKGAKWKLAGVVALTVLQSGISVAFSYIGRDLWNALSAKNSDKFFEEAGLFFLALLIGTPLVVLFSYSRDMLGLQWREWLTKRTLEEYFASRNYYDAENSNEVDNPDQRIAEDLRAFTQTSLQFILTLVISAVDLVSFSSILLSIYPQLFVDLILYSVFGTVTTTFIGRRLVGLNFAQLQTEADFRYSLVRLRENAESVAFYRGEDRERATIELRFDRAVKNFGNLIGWQRNLEFFTTAYRYLVQLLPAVLVAPLFFKGSIELGVVNQSFSAFNHILNDLSLVVSRFESLSEFTAGIDRLGELTEFLEKKRSGELSVEGGDEAGEAVDTIQLNFSASASVDIKDLRITTPDSSCRLLASNVNVHVKEGQRLLIVGPSGVGKSSLLRAIAGLWRVGSGQITRPNDDEVLFLPQRPYCSLGSLREQLTYPSPPDEVNIADEELLEILARVQLYSLAEQFGGLDAVRDWSDILSLGEQQRLAFGRLLVRNPKLAILDEATSALDLEAESRLYGFLAASGATVMSVGHRPSLLRYHDLKLKLLSDGGSYVEPVNRESNVEVELYSL